MKRGTLSISPTERVAKRTRRRAVTEESSRSASTEPRRSARLSRIRPSLIVTLRGTSASWKQRFNALVWYNESMHDAQVLPMNPFPRSTRNLGSSQALINLTQSPMSSFPIMANALPTYSAQDNLIANGPTQLGQPELDLATQYPHYGTTQSLHGGMDRNFATSTRILRGPFYRGAVAYHPYGNPYPAVRPLATTWTTSAAPLSFAPSSFAPSSFAPSSFAPSSAPPRPPTSFSGHLLPSPFPQSGPMNTSSLISHTEGPLTHQYTQTNFVMGPRLSTRNVQNNPHTGGLFTETTTARNAYEARTYLNARSDPSNAAGFNNDARDLLDLKKLRGQLGKAVHKFEQILRKAGIDRNSPHFTSGESLAQLRRVAQIPVPDLPTLIASDIGTGLRIYLPAIRQWEAAVSNVAMVEKYMRFKRDWYVVMKKIYDYEVEHEGSAGTGANDQEWPIDFGAVEDDADMVEFKEVVRQRREESERSFGGSTE